MHSHKVRGLELAIGWTCAYITAHLGHLERVQGLGITHVDPHRLLLVLHVGFLVLNLKHTSVRLNYYI